MEDGLQMAGTSFRRAVLPAVVFPFGAMGMAQPPDGKPFSYVEGGRGDQSLYAVVDNSLAATCPYEKEEQAWLRGEGRET